ncbi:transposase InsO family protein [Bradyrhizobium elkanii]|nr:transposase InsO family protein [Bradyrhizobium elkanii]MCS3573053.1 transposase InsO family protein [Bradyrhizobium elkanii]MCS3594254.1 transposase InsO family protein [Bradyrhizobium elkanii]MCS3623697.1 transposase InsO family protein [Bradyrhizobium elkanii]
MGLSERQACAIVGADRRMIRYRSRRPPDTELRARLRDLAHERRRFGYRRLFVLLRRESERSGINLFAGSIGKKDLRPASGGLAARRQGAGRRSWWKPGRMRAGRWTSSTTSSQTDNGRRFRILNIVDDVTKECLGAIPDTSISGRRVARELTTVIARRGKPGLIVSDNGTEFTCNAMLAWCEETGIGWHFITPGKPMQRCRTASSRASTLGCATSS